MTDALRSEEPENARIILGLLESVERDGGQSQRHLASDLGIALGLVNAYLRRCVKKGLMKVSEAPARRYIYYLTPQGIAEKSRLTVEYFSHSFSFFRQAKADCLSTLQEANANGFKRIILAGRSDLAEVAIICAMECDIEVVAVVDPAGGTGSFVGLSLFSTFEAVTQPYEAILITDLVSTQTTFETALARCDRERVLVPRMLRLARPL